MEKKIEYVEIVSMERYNPLILFSLQTTLFQKVAKVFFLTKQSIIPLVNDQPFRLSHGEMLQLTRDTIKSTLFAHENLWKRVLPNTFTCPEWARKTKPMTYCAGEAERLKVQ